MNHEEIIEKVLKEVLPKKDNDKETDEEFTYQISYAEDKKTITNAIKKALSMQGEELSKKYIDEIHALDNSWKEVYEGKKSDFAEKVKKLKEKKYQDWKDGKTGMMEYYRTIEEIDEIFNEEKIK